MGGGYDIFCGLPIYALSPILPTISKRKTEDIIIFNQGQVGWGRGVPWNVSTKLQSSLLQYLIQKELAS
mgnify:FL=1